MQDFRNLDVWRRGHELTLAVYRTTRNFPKEELYGLSSQVRRSASSIGCNIAEGCGRRGDAELARFLQIAAGSASELEYQLLLAHDLRFMSDSDYRHLFEEVTGVKRMLASLLQKVRGRITNA